MKGVMQYERWSREKSERENRGKGRGTSGEKRDYPKRLAVGVPPALLYPVDPPADLYSPSP
jgi:hypothetical protein